VKKLGADKSKGTLAVIQCRVFESRLFRRIFGHKRDEVTGKWRRPHKEELRERGHLEDLGIDWMIILKRIFKTWYVEAWTGLIWLRIGTYGRLL
jgi:hypothetical protein